MRKKKKNGFIAFCLISVALIAAFMYITALNDARLFETAKLLAESRMRQLSNEMIDKSVNKTIDELGISSEDFIINRGDASFSADTLLINKFCAKISSSITAFASDVEDEKIGVPIGAATGVRLFANLGPDVVYTIRPAGDVDVDYETSFEASGINQTNFKIWINIKTSMQIVNPLINSKIIIKRKIMLVDTVVKGEVPDGYMTINGREG